MSHAPARRPALPTGGDPARPRQRHRCTRCGAALPARDFREALTRFGLGDADQPLLTCLGAEEG